MAIKQKKPQPEYQLRHRLTGAVIIVLFAVLVIPLLFRQPVVENAAENSGGSNTINAADSDIFISKIEPLIPDSPGQPQSQPDEPDIPVSSADGQDGQQEDGDQVEPDQGDSATQQSESVVMNVDPALENAPAWIVQVGTYAKIKNIDSMSRQLADNGFKAQHTEVSTALSKATRVWVGPYDSKDKAEQVSLQLKELTGEKVNVVHRNP